MGVIGFRKAKCKDCYKCVRLCEVKAIRIKDEHAQFVASECVECGQCLEACPQNAITFIKDIQWIKSMVKNREKTVVSLAPAYLGYLEMQIRTRWRQPFISWDLHST